MKLKVLDLFAGIGGFSLGLERTGHFETVAFCEIDPKARKVLHKHWPNVPIFEDVKELTGEQLRTNGITVDVITGGFPCQDISTAGKGAGLAGERSGLWFEYYRIIKETSPSWVIIENVSALRSRGLDEVLRSLSEIGYDAEWHCIPASAVGAPHQRDRIWIVGHPVSKQQHQLFNDCGAKGSRAFASPRAIHTSNTSCLKNVADTDELRTQVSPEGKFSSQQLLRGESTAWRASVGRSWLSEPCVGRVANGVSGRVDRLKQLGNAVVPQIPELIGQAIIQQINNKKMES